MADRTLQFILTGRDAGASNALSAMGIKGEAVTGKIRSAFGKLGNQIGGEFGDILDKTGQAISDFGEKGKNAGAKMAVAGVGIAGLGVALKTLGSHEKQASDQLKAAIEATGHSYDEFGKQIEETVKHQENFGHAASDTKQALQTLTTATNSPKKALQDMNIVADLAAAKHESLATAAGQVAKVYAGSGKILKQYGITLESSKVTTEALTKAQDKHRSAVETLGSAQKRLSDLQEIDASKTQLSVSQQIRLANAREAVTAAVKRYGASSVEAQAASKKLSDVEEILTAGTKLTVSEQIQLRRAHETVAAAQKTLAETSKALTAAQAGVKTSTQTADAALGQLAGKLKGQAAASVDNFSARVDIAKTKLLDWAADMGNRWGGAVSTAGTLIAGFGVALELLKTRAASAAAAQVAQTAATEAEGAAAAGATVATAGFGASVLGVVGPLGAATAGALALKSAAHAMGVDVSLGTDQMLAAVNGAKGYSAQVQAAADVTKSQFTVALRGSAAAVQTQTKQVADASAHNTVFASALVASGKTADQLSAAIRGTKPQYDMFISQLVKSQQQGGTSNTVIRSNVSVLGSLRNAYLYAGGGAATQRGQVDSLNRSIHALPVSKATKVTADTLAARGDVRGLQRLLDELHGKTVSVNVVYAAQGLAKQQAMAGRAKGGPITGSGGPEADNVPIWASAGEYMMRASAVNKYGAKFMDAVNAGKFAAGGPITLRLPSNSSLASVLNSTASGMASKMTPSGPAAPGNISALQAYALSLFPSHGWGSNQLGALISMWQNESGWNPAAYNPNGGATGIPQALPGSKMASAGADWRTNGATQIRWGEDYIASVYGTPSNAWAQWQARSPHWYGKGLPPTVFTRPTVIGVGERGPETVSVTPGRGGAEGVHVTVNVAGSVVSEKDLHRSIIEAVDTARRRRGRGSLLDA